MRMFMQNYRPWEKSVPNGPRWLGRLAHLFLYETGRGTGLAAPLRESCSSCVTALLLTSYNYNVTHISGFFFPPYKMTEASVVSRLPRYTWVMQSTLFTCLLLRLLLLSFKIWPSRSPVHMRGKQAPVLPCVPATPSGETTDRSGNVDRLPTFSYPSSLLPPPPPTSTLSQAACLSVHREWFA